MFSMQPHHARHLARPLYFVFHAPCFTTQPRRGVSRARRGIVRSAPHRHSLACSRSTLRRMHGSILDSVLSVWVGGAARCRISLRWHALCYVRGRINAHARAGARWQNRPLGAGRNHASNAYCAGSAAVLYSGFGWLVECLPWLPGLLCRSWSRSRVPISRPIPTPVRSCCGWVASGPALGCALRGVRRCCALIGPVLPGCALPDNATVRRIPRRDAACWTGRPLRE